LDFISFGMYCFGICGRQGKQQQQEKLPFIKYIGTVEE
jgi:hypothetical protein